MALVENKMFNLLINIKSFLEQPIKASKKRKTFGNIKKQLLTTGNVLDYFHHQKY